jgi:hypothetical protein
MLNFNVLWSQVLIIAVVARHNCDPLSNRADGFFVHFGLSLCKTGLMLRLLKLALVLLIRYDSAPEYLIFDRGTQFNEEAIETMKSFGIQPKQTSFRSPWQNGVAERWVGNCRRDLFDHVIVLNHRHLKRVMNEYVRYYHDDRTHLALAKGTPANRQAVSNSRSGGRIIAMPRLGGLHHRYDLAA